MEIGISTGFFYEKDLIESLPMIQKCGFKILELWAGASEWGRYTHYNWHEKKYTHDLKKKLEELGLRVSSAHAPFSEELDLSNLDETQRRVAVDECCKVMDVLIFLEGEILVVHPAVKTFDLNNHEEKTRRIDQAVKSVSEIAEQAKMKKCKIAIENMIPHVLGGEISVLQQLIGNHRETSLGICFDSSHANLWKSPSLAEYLKSISPYLLTTHLSDNYGDTDDHFPPGDGEINWTGIFRIIRESGYQGVLMFEVLGESRTKDPRKILSKTYQRAHQLSIEGRLL